MACHRLTVVLVGLLVQGGIACAAPLDKDGCNKLKEEQGQLEKTGVRDSMAKGPQWAKANLAGDRLGEVRRLIEVDEQLLFLCSGKPLVVLPLESEGVATDDKDGSKPVAKAASAKASGTSPPAVKRAPAQNAEKKLPAGEAKALTAGRKGPAVSSTAAATTTAKSPHKALPKAKSNPKPDDAYRPPDSAADANPFATQASPAANK